MPRSRARALALVIAIIGQIASYQAASPAGSALAAMQAQAPTAPVAAAAQAATPDRRDVRYRIFARGVSIGGESATFTTTDTDWTIAVIGQIPALSLIINSAEIRYDRQGQPRAFSLDGRVKEAVLRITTTIAGGKATSEVIQGDKAQTVTHDISPNSILLPLNVYSAYQAVVSRLATQQPGAKLRAYVVTLGETDIVFDSVTTERVQTTARAFQSKHYKLTILNGDNPLKVEVFADDRNELTRVLIPTVPIDVMRDDIAVVSTRQQTSTTFRENDEDVRIPANGFNLAATLSKPVTPPPPPAEKGAPKIKPAKLPAVILVAGSGFVERDETIAGIPIFAQLAGALADAGHLVVRYDKRGVGQSGGRIESATLADYAEDVRAVVRFLQKRKDVDEDRIAVAGFSEGTAIAMLAAQREKKVRALVLMGGAGTSGADLLLEQQRAALDKLKLSGAERQERIDLQKKIQAASISGQGWDGIKPEVRRQAETPWFSSMLQFDPSQVLTKVKAPILIVHGDLDRQVPVHHADRLAMMANSRKKAGPTEIARFPALNHLLAPAKTGEVDEYPTLEPKAVSPDVPAKIGEWLKTTMAAKT